MRLFVTGEAGTGKSVVATTFAQWMSSAGLDFMYRRTAPTATAAALINGATVASLFGLGYGNQEAEEAEDGITIPRVDINLTSRLRDAHDRCTFYDFDEVSMIGHRQLSRVHDLLCAVNGSQDGHYFGGVDLCFSGDFHQFQPVADCALYQTPTKGPSHWNLTATICLTQVMRQDPAEVEFLSVLKQLRRGACDAGTFDILNRRVIGSPDVNISGAEWDEVAFIVARHNLRRQINQKKAASRALRLGQKLYLSPCYYQCTNGNPPTPDDLRNLRMKSPSAHASMESLLYLHIGMPVVLNVNQHTAQGVTNGSYGKILEIRFDERDLDAIQLTNLQPITILKAPPAQVIVQLSRSHPERAQLPGLPPDCICIVPSKGKATCMQSSFRDPVARTLRKKNKTYSFMQLPISPAYAVTDYRSQGATLNRIIVDLQRPPGAILDPASVYVALSRVKTLSGLVILRDFTLSDLNPPQDTALVKHEQELSALEEKTLAALQAVSLQFTSPPFATDAMIIKTGLAVLQSRTGLPSLAPTF